jgi:hypothetical protein
MKVPNITEYISYIEWMEVARLWGKHDARFHGLKNIKYKKTPVQNGSRMT